MDTFLFSGVGVGFILLAIFLIKKHKHFMESSIEVQGEIVDIIEKTHITRNTFGHVEDKKLFKHPVVKYRYHRFYQFQSDIDVSREDLSVGSSVSVRINPLKPTTAKLEIGLNNNMLFFWLMIGLGLFLIGIGAVQFKPSDYTNLSLFDNWLALGFILVGGIYLYIKIGPILSLMRYNSIYSENAKELDN